MVKLLFCASSLTNISTFMYLSPLNIDCVCYVIISAFYVFQGYFSYFMINEKLDSKTNSIFKLKIVENLKNDIKGKIIIL